jgi:hypothetical protein
MMQSASYGFLLIFTYLHQALLGLAEFTALFQNFRVFIPVIRELSFPMHRLMRGGTRVSPDTHWLFFHPVNQFTA